MLPKNSFVVGPKKRKHLSRKTVEEEHRPPESRWLSSSISELASPSGAREPTATAVTSLALTSEVIQLLQFRRVGPPKSDQKVLRHAFPSKFPSLCEWSLVKFVVPFWLWGERGGQTSWVDYPGKSHAGKFVFLRKISCVEVTNLPAAFCIQKRYALARKETAKGKCDRHLYESAVSIRVFNLISYAKGVLQLSFH